MKLEIDFTPIETVSALELCRAAGRLQIKANLENIVKQFLVDHRFHMYTPRGMIDFYIYVPPDGCNDIDDHIEMGFEIKEHPLVSIMYDKYFDGYEDKIEVKTYQNPKSDFYTNSFYYEDWR